MAEKDKPTTSKPVANKHLSNEKKQPPPTVDYVRRWGSDDKVTPHNKKNN
ncbi:hypothetical protein R3F64_13445 [Halomonas sp. 5021]